MEHRAPVISSDLLQAVQAWIVVISIMMIYDDLSTRFGANEIFSNDDRSRARLTS